MKGDDLASMTATELAQAIRAQQASPVQAVEAFLQLIHRLNPALNAYITVCADAAMEDARRAEAALLRGDAVGPLHGVPIAVKDQLLTRGILTTNGSRVYRDHVPQKDATVVVRLQEAGAILLGKTNMSEMALGGTREHPYGTPRNPWDLERNPGSSSSGSGIAVAAHLCAAALGEDTGGSVRNPAAQCGVVGLRPTFGLVSRYGLLPACWFVDTIGPLAKTVEDCALVLEAIAGHDPKDPLSSRRQVPSYTACLGQSVRGLRIAVVKELYESDVLDPEVKAAVAAAIEVLRELGAAVEEVSVPLITRGGPIFVALSDVEAAGVHEGVLRSRAHELDGATRTRLQAGALAPSRLYHRALRAKNLLHRQLHDALKGVDVLLSPTTPSAAPKYQQDVAQFESPEDVERRMYTRRSYLASFSLAALPAMSVPCGFTSNHLPVGLHLAGRPFAEETLFRAAYAYQQATEWHKRRAPVAAGTA